MVIDFRENRSKVPELLKRLDVPIQLADLATDYIISKKCFVERKTASDFLSSIADGRIFKQVTYLANTCANPVVILEGKGLYANEHIQPNIIRGVIIWITLKKRVPIIYAYDEYDTARILHLLVRKYGNTSSPTPPQQLAPASFQKSNSRKYTSSWQRQMAVLTQIPGIGRQTAKELLTSFGTLTNVLRAADRELMDFPRIGKERLKSIREIFPAQ